MRRMFPVMLLVFAVLWVIGQGNRVEGQLGGDDLTPLATFTKPPPRARLPSPQPLR
jgi:hypothetical protein